MKCTQNQTGRGNNGKVSVWKNQHISYNVQLFLLIQPVWSCGTESDGWLYSVNCECLSPLSHLNELNFIVVGSWRAENHLGYFELHLSHLLWNRSSSIASRQSSVSPWRILVDICKWHFDACEFHFSDNRALCKAIGLTFRDKDNIWGLFSWRQFTDQSKLLFICVGLMSLSLIPSAYPNTVEWLTGKVSLMYICLIRLPKEKWISLVRFLHIFSLQ